MTSNLQTSLLRNVSDCNGGILSSMMMLERRNGVSLSSWWDRTNLNVNQRTVLGACALHACITRTSTRCNTSDIQPQNIGCGPRWSIRNPHFAVGLWTTFSCDQMISAHSCCYRKEKLRYKLRCMARQIMRLYFRGDDQSINDYGCCFPRGYNKYQNGLCGFWIAFQ